MKYLMLIKQSRQTWQLLTHTNIANKLSPAFGDS